jgi:hypothetical protein
MTDEPTTALIRMSRVVLFTVILSSLLGISFSSFAAPRDAGEHLRECKALVKQTPESVEALCGLADAYTEMYIAEGKTERKTALLSLKKALDAAKLDDMSPLPHVSMARAYLAMGNVERTSDCIARALSLDPTNRDAKDLEERLTRKPDGEDASNVEERSPAPPPEVAVTPAPPPVAPVKPEPLPSPEPYVATSKPERDVPSEPSPLPVVARPPVQRETKPLPVPREKPAPPGRNRTYADGSRYEGDLSGGNRHGWGVCIFADGDKYEGEWRDDLKHGYGTFTWANGGVFTGNWVRGKRNGRGVYKYANGHEYDGYWVASQRDGQGTYSWPNGARYVGDWSKNDRNGSGVYLMGDGRRYDGAWKDDEESGHGTVTWPNGNRYVGEWVDGKRHGKGVLTYGDGSRYDGQWENGDKHGRGQFFSLDGASYVGEYANDRRTGHGTYSWASGAKYVGGWLEGKRSGRGVYTTAAGRVSKGLWRDDKRIQTDKKYGAEITNIRVDHGRKKNNQKGMLIHSKVIVDGCKGKKIRVSAYFSSKDGTALRDFDGEFKTSNGKVSVGKTATASYASSRWNDFALFIPNAQLHMPKGKHNLKFHITVWDMSGSPATKLGSSEPYGFQYTKK